MNFNDPSYLAIIETIVDQEIQDGRNILIIDATEFTTLDESLSYNEKYLRLFGCQNLRLALRERLLSKGCVFIDLSITNFNQVNPTFHEKIFAILEGDELSLSITSSISSQMRDEIPEGSIKYNSLKSRKYSECKAILSLLSLTMNDEIQRVFCLNGRWSDQKAFFLGARDFGSLNTEIFFYEKGVSVNTYFCEDFQTQDRINMQLAISKMSFLPDELDAANEWFHARKSNLSANIFLSQWREISIESKRISNRDACITVFPSSPDEFLALGSDWSDSSWLDQWDGISNFLEFASNNWQVQLQLRSHPNTAYKSTAQKKRVRDELRKLSGKFPTLNIISSNSKLSSYEILSNTDVSVVWNSTIGLESVWYRIPTVVLNSAEYDKIADVINVRNQSALLNLEYPLPAPDSNSALTYIAGRLKFDRPINIDFLHLNSFVNPADLRVRLASAATFGWTAILKLVFRVLFPAFPARSASLAVRRFLSNWRIN